MNFLEIFNKPLKDKSSFKIKKGNIKKLKEYKDLLVQQVKDLESNKEKNEKLTQSIKELNQKENELNNSIKELETKKYNIEEEILTTLNVRKAVLDRSEIEKEIEELKLQVDNLKSDIVDLKEEKAMILDEIEKLEAEKDSFEVNVDDSVFSIQYVDIIQNGLEFERYFAMILKRLGYENVEVTSGSGDYGIDVIGTKDDILYGFQCKLYTSPVGNNAIQEAYTGREHYHCNVAIVVTNNYFTPQAIQQAKETKVILWNRDDLIKKISMAKSPNDFASSFRINGEKVTL